MTCKDNCVHYETCYHIEHYGRHMETEEPCSGFKNKAEMAEWIDVNERLPEEGVWVLCLCKGNIYEVLRWNEKEYSWEKTVYRAYMNTFVTHWMPLPEPPKVGVSDGLY